ncbi:MAG: FAD-dependent oxidoreductase, partial [Pseudomonadota bacterium]
MSLQAIVIGAGMGGLCAALRLQAGGAATTLFESADHVGGKACNEIIDGSAIPCGPTVLTLKEVFDALFSAAGTRIDEMVTLKPLDVLAHHRWSATEELDLYHSVDESAEAISLFAGAREADGYRAFVADAKRIFETVDGPFISSPKPDFLRLSLAVGPFGASKIKPYSTLWTIVSRHFKDARLRQLFGRYATYCGSSPFLSPATLMLVAHAEQRGVWGIEGGLGALAAAIAQRFEELGGTIVTNMAAKEVVVAHGKVRGVVDGRGTMHQAGLVVFGGDVAALGRGDLGQSVAKVGQVTPPHKRSLSAVTIKARVRPQRPLHYHTVLFGRDYPSEMTALFQERRTPHDSTLYLCAPEHTTHQGTDQRVFMVMNAPAQTDHHDGEEDVAQCTTQAMETLTRCGLATTLS